MKKLTNYRMYFCKVFLTTTSLLMEEIINYRKQCCKADVNSKLAIDHLIEMGYATDSSEGTDNLVLAITTQGIDYINNKN